MKVTKITDFMSSSASAPGAVPTRDADDSMSDNSDAARVEELEDVEAETSGEHVPVLSVHATHVEELEDAEAEEGGEHVPVLSAHADTLAASNAYASIDTPVSLKVNSDTDDPFAAVSEDSTMGYCDAAMNAISDAFPGHMNPCYPYMSHLVRFGSAVGENTADGITRALLAYINHELKSREFNLSKNKASERVCRLTDRRLLKVQAIAGDGNHNFKKRLTRALNENATVDAADHHAIATSSVAPISESDVDGELTVNREYLAEGALARLYSYLDSIVVPRDDCEKCQFARACSDDDRY